MISAPSLDKGLNHLNSDLQPIFLSPNTACHLVNDSANLDDMEAPEDFDDLLSSVSGVESFQWFGFNHRTQQPRVRIHTKKGRVELAVEVFRSHLSQDMADHITTESAANVLPRLVLAPVIGSGLSKQFIEAGLCYLDARGNCHFDLEAFFVHVEGRTNSHSTTGSSDKGIRRAGYQVLFAYLAEPGLLNATMREVAAVAGVSRQPVSTLRKRLVNDGYIIKTKSKTRWNPSRFSDAINLWLQGYTATVRPAILRGRFRTRERNPDVLEEQITKTLEPGEFRWGGATAAYRMSPHYRGQQTVLVGVGKPDRLVKTVQAIPDTKGNLVLLDSFGDINGPSRDLVPPLLAYSELIQEGSERSREAAQVLYDEFIALGKRA